MHLRGVSWGNSSSRNASGTRSGPARSARPSAGGTNHAFAEQRVYSLGLGWLKIDAIETIDDLSSLTPADVQADGFASVDELLAALKSMYPDTAGDGKRWYLVRFHADALLPDVPPTSKSSSTKALSDPR